MKNGTCAATLIPRHVETLAKATGQLAEIASVFADGRALDEAHEALVAVHQLQVWKRGAKAAPFRPVDPETVVAARVRMQALGAQLLEAGRLLAGLRDELAAIAKLPGRKSADEVSALVSSRVRGAIEPLGAAVNATIREAMSPLMSSLLEEVLLLDDWVCTEAKRVANRSACDQRVAISEASKHLHTSGVATRGGFDELTANLELGLGDLLDTQARTALARVTGRGPSYGAPCGPEDLCAENLTCEASTVDASRSCEVHCSEGAMQPCPGHTGCASPPGHKSVCRRGSREGETVAPPRR